MLESSLRSWPPPWDVCGGLAFLQQLFGSSQAIAALWHGASLLSRQTTRGEQRCHRDWSVGLGEAAPRAMSLHRRALGLAVRETLEVPCSVVS